MAQNSRKPVVTNLQKKGCSLYVTITVKHSRVL
uniref:Uncharacterized protein n=1 Tax=Anguilla anguilla TaxID=7936 RepID=A0A0E9XAL5_ANGAN